MRVFFVVVGGFDLCPRRLRRTRFQILRQGCMGARAWLWHQRYREFMGQREATVGFIVVHGMREARRTPQGGRRTARVQALS